jgi:hypothetical protein
MPKSQFDSPVAVRAGRAAVTGIVDPDTDAAGKAAGAPVVVHWVLEQGGVVANGTIDADGTRFTDEEASAQAWKPGAAHASGVTVVVRRAPAGIETFEWEQEVELKLD